MLRLDKTRHALSCGSCGAPLNALKLMPVPRPQRRSVTHQPAMRRAAPVKQKVKKKSKPGKKRKGWFGKRLRDIAEDVFDVVEDIFD